MRIIKFQAGGLPSTPVDYRKAWLGYLSGLSEQSQGTSSSTATSFASDEKGAIGIFTKEMTDLVMKETLPVDGEGLIEMSVNFEKYIDPNNPEQARAIYTHILQKLQESTYAKIQNDKAIEEARKNKAMNGPAIATDGTVWVRKNGTITRVDANTLKPSDRVITVAELAWLRAHNEHFRYNQEAIVAVDNATSMKEIQEHINNIVNNIGSLTTKNPQYLSKQQIDQIQGLQDVLSASIDGIYKLTVNNVSNVAQANALIDFVYNTLENNKQTYLTVLAKRFKIRAKDEHGNRIDPVRALLMQFIQGKYTYTTENDISFEKDMSAAYLGYDIYGNKKEGSGSEKSISDIESSPITDFFLQRAQQQQVDIQYGRGHLTAIGTKGILYDSSMNPLGTYVTLNTVANSGHAQGMNVDKMYFGSTKVDNKFRNKVIVDGSSLINVALPIDPRSSEDKPDFTLFSKLTDAYKEVERRGIKDPRQINQIFQKYDLPAIYSVGSDGKAVITPRYKQFAVMHGYADRQALQPLNGDDIGQVSTIQKPDKKELDAIVELIRNTGEENKNYKPTYDSILPGFKDPDLYEGSVFIPIYDNPVMYLNTKWKLRDSETILDAYSKVGKENKEKPYNRTPKVSGLTR